MRIAVSGTHGVGKSTLIEEFLRVHPEFVHEPEPYEVLVEDYGEEFSAEPCVEDFLRQLEFNLERVGQHEQQENVIYERCPLDFLAYLTALDANVPETLRKRISDATQQLDLIVYLPLDDASADDEFPKLRRAVDQKLSELLNTGSIVVVEATGSTTQRRRAIDQSISKTHPGDASQRITS
ncbi:MAG TPA: AAA family ATPase [Pyrinomonadaceae bacterium]|nr:AAA family ATPase [Pyrinomonadaceae bacterium]